VFSYTTCCTNVFWQVYNLKNSYIILLLIIKSKKICPYTNQHTDPANRILTTTGKHSLTPSSSVYFQTKETAPGKQKYTQKAKPTSSANQPVAEQTGQQATCIRGDHLTNERQFIGKQFIQKE